MLHFQLHVDCKYVLLPFLCPQKVGRSSKKAGKSKEIEESSIKSDVENKDTGESENIKDISMNDENIKDEDVLIKTSPKTRVITLYLTWRTLYSH